MLFAGVDGFFERVIIGATVGRVKCFGFINNIALPSDISDNAVNFICHNSIVLVPGTRRVGWNIHRSGYKYKHYFLFPNNFS